MKVSPRRNDDLLFVFLCFMKYKKIFLLLNGEIPKELPNLANYDVICATDGAYNFLKEQHITPNFISGDFDSLENLPKDIQVPNVLDPFVEA